MNKFEGILLCTDLDGTLLGTDKCIPKANKEAIAYFKSRGGAFTFVTGRMPFFVSDVYHAVQPNRPIGCINGGGIYDFEEKKFLWMRELPRLVLELVAHVQRSVEGIGIQVNTAEHVWFCQENDAMVLFRQITGLPNLTCHYNDVTEPIAKIVFGSEDEERIAQTAACLSEHPLASEFDFIRSEKSLYEILPKGAGKGPALLKMAQLFGIDPKKTIAVGDYNNDISMLRCAGIGYAVANACPEAKAAADRLTVSNDEGAIAKIIEELDMGIVRI